MAKVGCIVDSVYAWYAAQGAHNQTHTERDRHTLRHISGYTDIFQYKLLSVVVHKTSHKLGSCQRKGKTKQTTLFIVKATAHRERKRKTGGRITRARRRQGEGRRRQT